MNEETLKTALSVHREVESLTASLGRVVLSPQFIEINEYEYGEEFCRQVQALAMARLKERITALTEKFEAI